MRRGALMATAIALAGLAGCAPGGHSPGRAACSWRRQKPGPAVHEDLAGVSFPDTTHGWVVGGIGGPVIRATADGGRTWRAQHTADHEGLSAVSFVDDRHGWAVGERGEVIATADGGATWRRPGPRAGGGDNLYGVSFVDAHHGWVVGEKGRIEATTDGGRTWRRQASETHADLEQVRFGDPRHGWVLSNDGRVLRTLDGGRTWAAVYTASAKDSEAVAGISVLDARHVWAAGSEDKGESNYGAVSRTGDGGRTWKHVLAGKYDDERFGPVAFTDAAHGWVASPLDGDLWYSDDGGRSWGSRPSPTAEEIHDMVFRDRSHGWAVGSADTILACVR